MPRRTPIALVALLLLVSAAAQAQVPTQPRPVLKHDKDVVTIPLTSSVLPGAGAASPKAYELPLQTMTRLHQSGDWKRLQALAVERIRDVSCHEAFFDLAPDDGTPCAGSVGRIGLDIARTSVLVAWVGRDYKGEPALLSVIVPQSISDPYKAVLPGVQRIYQLFLADQPGVQIASRLISTPADDPVTGQLPAVASAVLGPLFTFAARVSPVMQLTEPASQTLSSRSPAVRVVEGKPAVVNHYVRLAAFALPMRRSSAKWEMQASIPMSQDSFVKQAMDLESKLAFTDVFASACGAALATALAGETARIVKNEPDCSAESGTETACRALFDRQYRARAAEVRAACQASGSENATLNGVEKKFRELVDGAKASRAGGELALVNAPKIRLSFGALASFAFKPKLSSTRVKLDSSGKYTADPVARTLSMVVLNVALRPYQAASSEAGTWQRVRAFGGFVVSPDFGVGVGASLAIVKGLGANLGVAWIGIPTINGGRSLGETPANPSDAFGLGHARVLFLGASYNFGK